MAYARVVRDNDSVTKTCVLEAFSPLGLSEICLAARVIVAVHVADDVSCSVGVSASLADCAVGMLGHIVMHSHIDRVAVHAEGGHPGIVIIGGEYSDLIVHSLLGSFPGEFRIGVADTHRKPEFQ